MPQADFEAVVESAAPPGTTKLARSIEQRHLHPQDRVRAVTEQSLDEMSRSVAAGKAAEALLTFERHADLCGVELIVDA
jgi:hypothetical protein